MRIYTFSITLLSILLFAASCHKSDNNTTSYTFVNQLSAPVNIAIYANVADYDSVSNALISATIAPNTSYNLRTSALKAGGSYYIDYYTSDYVYTNWINIPGTGSFNPTITIDSSFVIAARPDYARLLCINGNEKRTYWKAVDGSVYINSSVASATSWSALTTTQKYLEIEFQKNMTATLFFYDVNGNLTSLAQDIKTDTATDSVSTTTGTLSLTDNGMATGNIGYSLSLPSGTPGAKVGDTITVQIDHESGSFYRGTLKLVKEAK